MLAPPKIVLRFATKNPPRLALPTWDMSLALERLCHDLCSRCPEFYHIDPARLVFNLVRNRKRTLHGLQARITPMRFEGGLLTGVRRQRSFQIQRFFLDGREILYHLAFCVPRFLMLSPRERLITIIHELFHIDPSFHGGLRRFEGACPHHGPSKRDFDLKMAEFLDRYQMGEKDEEAYQPFLFSMVDFRRSFSGVEGWCAPKPRLIPLNIGQTEIGQTEIAEDYYDES